MSEVGQSNMLCDNCHVVTNRILSCNVANYKKKFMVCLVCWWVLCQLMIPKSSIFVRDLTDKNILSIQEYMCNRNPRELEMTKGAFFGIFLPRITNPRLRAAYLTNQGGMTDDELRDFWEICKNENAFRLAARKSESFSLYTENLPEYVFSLDIKEPFWIVTQTSYEKAFKEGHTIMETGETLECDDLMYFAFPKKLVSWLDFEHFVETLSKTIWIPTVFFIEHRLDHITRDCLAMHREYNLIQELMTKYCKEEHVDCKIMEDEKFKDDRTSAKKLKITLELDKDLIEVYLKDKENGERVKIHKKQQEMDTLNKPEDVRKALQDKLVGETKSAIEKVLCDLTDAEINARSLYITKRWKNIDLLKIDIQPCESCKKLLWTGVGQWDFDWHHFHINHYWDNKLRFLCESCKQFCACTTPMLEMFERKCLLCDSMKCVKCTIKEDESHCNECIETLIFGQKIKRYIQEVDSCSWQTFFGMMKDAVVKKHKNINSTV